MNALSLRKSYQKTFYRRITHVEVHSAVNSRLDHTTFSLLVIVTTGMSSFSFMNILTLVVINLFLIIIIYSVLMKIFGKLRLNHKNLLKSIFVSILWKLDGVVVIIVN